jgi:CBS domain-containing protein
MSNDVRILLPAMTAITLAKWVADAGSRSLYHSLLELKCVPFLPKEALPGAALELLEVRHVMAAPVVTLRERVTLGELRDVLRSTRHHGFPVVREAGGGGSRTASGKGGGGGGNGEFGADDYGGDFSGGGGGGANGGGATASSSSGGGDWVFVGTVAREHLLRLLLEAVRRGTAAHLALEYGELQRGGTADPGAAPAEEAQQLAVLQGRPPTPGHFPAPPGLWAETLDLSPYVNLSAHAVPEAFSVARAYVLFSTMGLRHLVVVDARNRVRGVITRKDLLGFRLEEAVARGAGGVGRGAPA